MIHFVSHWVKQICQYWAFQSYSAERHEQALKMNLKDSWNACNHKLPYLPHTITLEHHIHCFEIRELNLQVVTQSEENYIAACTVLPSGTDVAAPLSVQFCAKHEFMQHPTCWDRKHPAVMITDFRALLENTRHATHSEAMESVIWQFMKQKRCTKTYILNEQLHAVELCIYHSLTVHVKDLAGERLSQMCRWTGSKSWHGGDRQND